MTVLNAVNKKWGSVLKDLVTDPLSIGPLAKGIIRLSKEQKRIAKATNPANLPYFSATPYRLGKKGPNSTAIKFGAYRVKCESETYVNYAVNKEDEKQVNYLRDSLKYTLYRQPICFQYLIQNIKNENEKVKCIMGNNNKNLE